MKPLEDHLQHSQRIPQRLSAAERSDMLKTIMAAQPSLPEIHEPVQHRMPWKWSLLLLPVGGFALLIAFIVSTNSTTTNQLANTNTTTTLPEISDSPLLADTSGIVPVNNYVLSDDFTGGGAGISGFDYSQWSIEYSGSALSKNTLTQPITHIKLLTNEQLQAIAKRIPGQWNTLEFVTYPASDNYSITYYSNVNIDSGSIPDCVQTMIDNNVPPCLNIDSTGRVDIAHIPSSGPGLATAVSYVEAITKTDSKDWLLRSSIREEHGTSGYIEYDMFPQTPLLIDGIPVRNRPWHIIIDKETDELRGIQGWMSTITPIDNQVYEVISADEAYQRFLTDLSAPLADNEKFTYTSLWNNEYFPGRYQTDTDVELTINSVRLEYHPALPDDIKKRGTQQFIPIYRINGIDKNTTKPFEAFVNGSADPELLNYSL